MASKLPWKSPGASGEPTSAMTSTVMVVGVTPTSLACRFAPLHFEDAADAVPDEPPDVAGVVAPDAVLPPLLRAQAVAAITAAMITSSHLDRLNRPPCRSRASPPPA